MRRCRGAKGRFRSCGRKSGRSGCKFGRTKAGKCRKTRR